MNDKVKLIAREILQPVFDQLVDVSCGIFSSVYDNLPDNMPAEEKEKLVQGIIEQQRDALVTSIKAGVPPDFDKQLKEAMNGGK